MQTNAMKTEYDAMVAKGNKAKKYLDSLIAAAKKMTDKTKIAANKKEQG